MTTAPAASATFAPHHVQLVRAAFAAIAAVMITFSPDHSDTVGLAVFSGFAIATGLVWAVAAWLTYPAGGRGVAILLAAVSLIAGMTAGVTPWRSITLFFVVVIAWAVVSGLIEGTAGLLALRKARQLRERDAERFENAPMATSDARDALTVGIITIVLAVGLLFVPADYSLEYFIPDAGRSFTLTGIAIAVGVFGGYAAVIAVYLGIAGFSPRRRPAAVAAPAGTSTNDITAGGQA